MMKKNGENKLKFNKSVCVVLVNMICWESLEGNSLDFTKNNSTLNDLSEPDTDSLSMFMTQEQFARIIFLWFQLKFPVFYLRYRLKIF